MMLPLITAHSGCEGTDPNSRDHLEAAIDSGADVVEVDVRSAADGICVLSHDETIACDDGKNPAIRQSAANDLVRRAPGLLRLSEVLAWAEARGVSLNLDLKEDAAVPSFFASRGKGRVGPGIVFSGCGPETARLVKSFDDAARIVLEAGQLPVGGSEKSYREAASKICDLAVDLGCCGLNVDRAVCSPSLFAIAATRFLPVYVYTVDEEAELGVFAAAGAFSITTHRVGAARRILESCRPVSPGAPMRYTFTIGKMTSQ
jgi:glycerophosphoryl diester phosphodiesterase